MSVCYNIRLMEIVEDNLLHINRFKNNEPHQSYIAGLIDGDGTLFIRKIKNGFQSGVSIAQSRTNVLQVIRFHFGGNITSSINRNSKVDDDINECNNIHKYNKRNQYTLVIRSNECNLIVDKIKNFIIIKQKQCESLSDFLKFANKPENNVEKNKLYEICSIKKDLQPCEFNRLNIEYIQGLFDAEGCVYIDKNNHSKYKISITQKSHPTILFEIKNFLGFGYVNEFNYVIYNKKHCLEFIRLIKNGLIVKYNQTIAFEIFLKTDDVSIKEKMYKVCNEEKHKTEIFTNLNKNLDGKDRFYENMLFRQNKDKMCTEIKILNNYKEKSTKMKGCNNHNYGKTFTEETRKKMSTSIRNSKCGVSDETILEVRNLIMDGLMNKHIQEKMDLSRHTVTRIKNKQLVCRTEQKYSTINKTQEQLNVSKRKITLDELLIVVEKCVEQKKPADILKYLIEKRTQNNIEINLTIDIIKNIKRNISAQKIPFYPFEMSIDKFNYYKIMIETWKKDKD